MLAELIGHLGHRLRPLLVKGSQNSNNILYIIAFSSEKKKQKKERKRKARFSHLSDMKDNPITKFFACRRKDYKRQKEETNKKRQKKERRKKNTHSLTLSILILKKIHFLVGLLINWCWQLGVSTGRARLGLCPTQTRPDPIYSGGGKYGLKPTR